MYSNDTGSAVPALPSYSPADYHRVQQGISDVFEELRQIAPALNDNQKEEALSIIGINGFSSSTVGYNSNGKVIQFDVDQVSAQYALVQALREKVLTTGNDIREFASAKDLSALINAINSTIALFLRNQEKIDHLKEIRMMREATILAMKDMPPEIQANFFKRIEELRSSSK